MKILHATEVESGGTISVIRHLFRHQTSDSRINQIAIVAPDSITPAIDSENYNFFLYRRSGRNITSLLRFIYTLLIATLKERPNIIHLHSSYAGALGRLLAPIFYILNTKIVYCPHGYSFLMEGSSRNKRFFSGIERLLSLLPQKIICVSQFECNAAIVRGITKHKIKVIYNGVEDITPPHTRHRNQGAVKFLFLGRHDRAKGFDILLQAMGFIEKKDHIHLVVAGISKTEISVTPFPPNIDFKGWVDPDTVKHILGDVDVLVLPSRWEGFPMVALEAMSAGVPVLASNCTSIPEAVKNGVNGYTFPVGDAYELAKLMTQTSISDWKLMGKNARKEYENKYRASRMCNETLDLYLALSERK